MANMKISEMQEIAEVSGTEHIPIVADGANRKISISNLQKKLVNIDDAVGRKTDNNGEIFNAIESNIANGEHSHAEGSDTQALEYSSHAEGMSTKASGSAAHAEGYVTEAEGYYSHAECYQTKALEMASHAEGDSTIARNAASHAEGYGTEAAADNSHAEGYNTKTTGDASHAEGYGTVAGGLFSHTEGSYTITQNENEHAQGIYNRSNTGASPADMTVHSIGIGVSDPDRRNAVEVMSNGDVYIKGIGDYDGTNPGSATDLATVVNGKGNRKKPSPKLVINRAIPIRPMPGMQYFTTAIKIKNTDIGRFGEIDLSSFNPLAKYSMLRDGRFITSPTIPDKLTLDNTPMLPKDTLLIHLSSEPCVYAIKFQYERSKPLTLSDITVYRNPSFFRDGVQLYPSSSPNIALTVNPFADEFKSYVTKIPLRINKNNLLGGFTPSGFRTLNIGQYFKSPLSIQIPQQMYRHHYRVFYYRRRITLRNRNVNEDGYRHSVRSKPFPDCMIRTRPLYFSNSHLSTGTQFNLGLINEYTPTLARPSRKLRIHVYKRWRNKLYRYLEISGSTKQFEVK